MGRRGFDITRPFWRVTLFYLKTLAAIFLLAISWEFALEENAFLFFGGGYANESWQEHWRYINTIMCFSAVSLIIPCRILYLGFCTQNVVERGLQKSERSLANAQRISGLGNWDWNIVTNELAWSDEIYRIFGLVPQESEATYDAFLSSIHPDDRELVERSVKEALHDNKPYDIEHRIVLSDGTEKVVHERAEVKRDESGIPNIMSGTVHDITERVRAKEALREGEEQYRILVETTPHGIQEIDATGNILFSNQALCQMLGYGAKEMQNMHVADLLPGDIRDQVLADILKLVKEQPEPQPYYNTNLTKDGRAIDVEVNWGYKRNKNGDIIGFTSIITDISQQKLTQSQFFDSEIGKHAAQDALDQIPFGIIIVDGDAKVRFLNQTARHITDKKDGLLIRKDIIFTSAPTFRHRLVKIIQRTIEGVKHNYSLPNEVLVLPRAYADEPLSVMVCALWGNHLQFGLDKTEEPLAILFVTAPERKFVAHAQNLQNLFGLTKAEAIITEKLVSGMTLEEMATELKVSKHTPRKHLKTIFGKTGTNSQAQLVKLVMSTPVWFGPTE